MSSDRFLMVEPLSYFSLQSVLHDWFNKDYVMGVNLYGLPVNLTHFCDLYGRMMQFILILRQL